MNNALIDQVLHFADTTLILSQRNGEWCGHGPVLEQDIAITNISLDLLGQSRSFYQYAAQLINEAGATGYPKAGVSDRQPYEAGNATTSLTEQPLVKLTVTEDSLAYLRNERDFKNTLLTELPIGDWAFTILRQFFFSVYQSLYYEQLLSSKDETLAAIAEKSLKEVTYHLRWSSEWVIRLGDGTDESRRRIQQALQELWSFSGECFVPVAYETALVAQGIVPDVSTLKQAWLQKVEEVFEEATLDMPAGNAWMQTGGKNGIHTEHLGFVLAEMQHLQRVYPGAAW